MLAVPASMANSGAIGAWDRMGRNQRLGLIGLGVAAVVLLAVFANIARSPDFTVAFSNLRDEDAAAIVGKLKESKIPYELAERGTIRVPSAQVQEVRLLAAASGLAQKGGSVGMEIFSQPHFGLTEFAEKVNYQRALEGELSRTINRLDAVESARVHLVVPQPSLFLSEKKEPTGAAVLQLKPGRRLDASQVQGITNLMAGSVEGLKLQNVTVMDTAGNVLSERPTDNDAARLSANRAEAQRALESRLAEDVRAMLSPVVGPDRSVVRISAEMDWDLHESNSETFSPQQRAPQVRSKREITETNSQGTSATGGVPGAERNVPSYPSATTGSAGQSQAERKDTTTNFELSKTVEKTVRAPGGIKRLNVAVALDSEVIADPAQADAISRLVATAAGLDTSRGDLVTLTSLPFSPSAEKKMAEAADAARTREMIFSVLRMLAMALGPLLVVMLLWMVLRKGRSRAAGPRITIAESAAGQAAAFDDRPHRELPRAKPADPEQERVQRELNQMANNDPAMVAQLVRTWMSEEKAQR